MEQELIQYLNESFALELKENNHQQLMALLAGRINHLINADFSKLVQILYRIDVNETKLKRLLKENDTANAADIIAALVVERQLQKITSRRESRRDENNFDEAEKW